MEKGARRPHWLSLEAGNERKRIAVRKLKFEEWPSEWIERSKEYHHNAEGGVIQFLRTLCETPHPLSVVLTSVRLVIVATSAAVVVHLRFSDERPATPPHRPGNEGYGALACKSFPRGPGGTATASSERQSLSRIRHRHLRVPCAAQSSAGTKAIAPSFAPGRLSP